MNGCPSASLSISPSVTYKHPYNAADLEERMTWIDEVNALKEDVLAKLQHHLGLGCWHLKLKGKVETKMQKHCPSDFLFPDPVRPIDHPPRLFRTMTAYNLPTTGKHLRRLSARAQAYFQFHLGIIQYKTWDGKTKLHVCLDCNFWPWRSSLLWRPSDCWVERQQWEENGEVEWGHFGKG